MADHETTSNDFVRTRPNRGTHGIHHDRRHRPGAEFVGEGRGSRALAQALEAAERDAASLRAEIKGLDRSRESPFESPPVAWIQERLTTLQAVLEQRTEAAALLLRRLLGRIQMEPVRPEIGRPFYRAVSTLDMLAIIEDEVGRGELNLTRVMMRSAKELISYSFWFSLRSRTPANITDLVPEGPFY